jgi:hypothetical protein
MLERELLTCIPQEKAGNQNNKITGRERNKNFEISGSYNNST